MAVPPTIVPAFPFEGGLFWLLGEVTVRHSRDHPYYRRLYGPDPDKTAGRAGALVSVFDRIELAGADHGLPDAQAYRKGEAYYHPDLRLSLSHADAEWSSEGRALAEFAGQQKDIAALFDGHPLFVGDEYGPVHFISRLVAQVRLAIRRDAVIVGDEFFQRVYRAVAPFIKQFVDDTPGALPEGLTLAINERTITVTGLEFAPSNYDAFAAVRISREISDYSGRFRAAIDEARTAADFEASLLELMKQAMESERVARLATGAFQTTGSVLNIAGLVPVVGSVTSVANIATDIAARATEAQEKRQRWYLLGPKMREVALKDILKRRV